MQLECELRVCHTDQCPIASRPRSRHARARTHCSAQICRLTEPESLLEFASRLVEPTGIRHEPTALLALARAAVLDAIPGVPVSMVTGDRELSSTRTVAHRERGRPARNSRAYWKYSEFQY